MCTASPSRTTTPKSRHWVRLELPIPLSAKLTLQKVYFVLAFETAQTIMNGVDVFNNYARGFGNLLIISNPYLGSVYTPIMGSIMSMIVQLFFCYRIWLISHMPWLGGGISLVSFFERPYPLNRLNNESTGLPSPRTMRVSRWYQGASEPFPSIT